MPPSEWSTAFDVALISIVPLCMILFCSKGRYTKSEKEWRERCIALSLDPDKKPKPTKEEWERAKNYECSEGEKPKNPDVDKFRERAIMDKLGIEDGSAGSEELKRALEKEKRKRREKDEERRARRYEEKCKRRDERVRVKKEKEEKGKGGSKEDSAVTGADQTDVEVEGGTTGVTEGATTGITEGKSWKKSDRSGVSMTGPK